MRIGILTLPLHYNYGGIMQAYALQTVLRRMGNDVRLIDIKYPPKPGIIGKIRHFLSPIKQYVLHNVIPGFLARDTCRYTRKFINKQINRDEYYSTSDILENRYDIIIVGSDQIWRRNYFKASLLGRIEPAFLDFAQGWNIRRIAYGASFGTEELDYEADEIHTCASLLKLFYSVSVREESGVTLCKKHFGCDTKLVLDPTLLLSDMDYFSLIQDYKKRDLEIISYILDENDEKGQIVEHICKALSMGVCKASASYNDLDKGKRGVLQPSVEQWLCAFRDARFVITDSYHGCVFSIIFNKPFVVLQNKDRGNTRIDTLLKLTHQEFRFISAIEPFNREKAIIQPPNSDLHSMRDLSISFLKQSIKS